MKETIVAWIAIPVLALVLGQGVDDAFKGIREFGLSVVMNVVFLIVLWYVAARVLPAELERRQKSFDALVAQLRQDQVIQITQLRDDQREESQRAQDIINLQRTEFLGALSENQKAHKEEVKELIAMQKENNALQKEAVGRIERHLEEITAEVKAMRGGGNNNKG